MAVARERWWVPIFLLTLVLAETMGIVWMYFKYIDVKSENDAYREALWSIVVDSMRALRERVGWVAYQYEQSRESSYACSVDAAMIMLHSGAKYAQMGARAIRQLGHLEGNHVEGLAGERYKLYLLATALDALDIYMNRMEQVLVRADSTLDVQDALADHIPLLREVEDTLGEIVFKYHDDPGAVPEDLVYRLLRAANTLGDLAYGIQVEHG